MSSTDASKEEKYSCDLPTTNESELKNDGEEDLTDDSNTNEATSSCSSAQDPEDVAQSPNEEDSFHEDKEDSSHEDAEIDQDNDKNIAQVNKGSNATRPEQIFHPSLEQYDSMVISEIDSQNESDMNDSEKIGDLLATIANATKKVDEKRHRLQQEDCHHPDEVTTTTATSTTLSPSPHQEDNFATARSTDTADGVVKESNISPTEYQQHQQQQQQQHQQQQQQPHFQSPYGDANAPMMMVPNQHLLQQMQMQQVQQMQMNFVPLQNNPNSGLPSPMYTTTTTPHPHPHVAHNNNPIMVHAPSAPNPGRRKMTLRLVEDIHTTSIIDHNNEGAKKSIFSRLSRRTRTRSMGSCDYDDKGNEKQEEVMEGSPQRLKATQKHGEISISWYGGTSAVELQDHVRKSVETKLRIGRKKLLLNLCMIDESVEPPEGEQQWLCLWTI
jgi:hypothetical protein